MIDGVWEKEEADPCCTRFLILDSSHAPLKRFDAVALPLHRNVVLEKSVEFFQDPNPCAIHEGAVRMRMLGELEAYLKGKGTVPLSAMPDSLRRYLELGEDAVFIALLEDGMTNPV